MLGIWSWQLVVEDENKQPEGGVDACDCGEGEFHRRLFFTVECHAARATRAAKTQRKTMVAIIAEVAKLNRRGIANPA